MSVAVLFSEELKDSSCPVYWGHSGGGAGLCNSTTENITFVLHVISYIR